ncbi:MAG TPA: PaaI family thioesterase [Acidimicrobiales bacterium]
MALQIPPNCDLTLGLVCLDKSTPGTSTWEMRADERFANPAGLVQGGFLAAALDSAMGASAVSAQAGRRVFVANTEMKVSFVRPARVGRTLRVVATVLKSGKVICFVEARVYDDTQELVATASSTYLVRERQ